MSGQLRIALAHAARGREVFPLGGDNGKRPLVRWTEAATSDPDAVRRLFRARGATGVGWRLPPGVVVVDVDDPRTFLDAGLDLPRGPGQKTPRGMHVLYSVPEGAQVRQGPIPGGDLKVGGKGYVRLLSEDAFEHAVQLLDAADFDLTQLPPGVRAEVH